MLLRVLHTEYLILLSIGSNSCGAILPLIGIRAVLSAYSSSSSRRASHWSTTAIPCCWRLLYHFSTPRPHPLNLPMDPAMGIPSRVDTPSGSSTAVWLLVSLTPSSCTIRRLPVSNSCVWISSSTCSGAAGTRVWIPLPTPTRHYKKEAGYFPPPAGLPPPAGQLPPQNPAYGAHESQEAYQATG